MMMRHQQKLTLSTGKCIHVPWTLVEYKMPKLMVVSFTIIILMCNIPLCLPTNIAMNIIVNANLPFKLSE